MPSAFLTLTSAFASSSLPVSAASLLAAASQSAWFFISGGAVSDSAQSTLISVAVASSKAVLPSAFLTLTSAFASSSCFVRSTLPSDAASHRAFPLTSGVAAADKAVLQASMSGWIFCAQGRRRQDHMVIPTSTTPTTALTITAISISESSETLMSGGMDAPVTGSVTPVASFSPSILRAVLSLVMRASPEPSVDFMTVTAAASLARILVWITMPGKVRRRAALIDKINTFCQTVPAALAIAFLNEFCTAVA